MGFFRGRLDRDSRRSSSSPSGGGGGDGSSGGRCTWPVAFAFFLTCVVGGVLTWRLPDWDAVVGGVLPDLTRYTSAPAALTSGPSSSPTAAPTARPPPFSECADPYDANATCCNGLASSCALRANDAAYAASHNAMSSAEDGFAGPNHLRSLERGLRRGYRALLLDLCDCGSQGLRLCHTLCAAGTRNPEEVLRHVRDFLRSFPREVIVLVFQIGREVTGARPIPVAKLDLVMKTVPGLTELLYDHDAANVTNWPTLGELVEADQRLLLFHHGSNTCTVQDSCPRGLHYYYEHAVDTPFSFRSVRDLETYGGAGDADDVGSCSLSLGRGGDQDFFGVNHFVTRALPDADVARKVNRRDPLEDRIRACEERHPGLRVNFMAVDFWSLGQLPEVVQDLNRRRAAEAAERRNDDGNTTTDSLQERRTRSGTGD